MGVHRKQGGTQAYKQVSGQMLLGRQTKRTRKHGMLAREGRWDSQHRRMLHFTTLHYFPLPRPALQHPWSPSVRAFIDLEANGAGGPSGMFQVTRERAGGGGEVGRNGMTEGEGEVIEGWRERGRQGLPTGEGGREAGWVGRRERGRVGRSLPDLLAVKVSRSTARSPSFPRLAWALIGLP